MAVKVVLFANQMQKEYANVKMYVIHPMLFVDAMQFALAKTIKLFVNAHLIWWVTQTISYKAANL